MAEEERTCGVEERSRLLSREERDENKKEESQESVLAGTSTDVHLTTGSASLSSQLLYNGVCVCV